MLLTEITNALLQLAVFSLIPFVAYLITKKKIKGFLGYIGLFSAPKKAVLLAMAVSTLLLVTGVGFTAISPEIRQHMFDPQSLTGKFRALGATPVSLFVLLLIAWVKTAFAEEILFRGFVAKRLMASLGYQWGNIIQAIIFGLLHSVLFYFAMNAGWFFMVFIFILSGIAAYIMAYINEKVANGSILPGWIAHGLGNMLSYSFTAFVL